MTNRPFGKRVFTPLATAAIFALVLGQLTAPAALAQTKPQISKDKDIWGNDVTTKTWEDGGKQYSESVHTNKGGKMTEKETVVVGPEGTTSEKYSYKGDGSDTPTSKWKETKDDKGKVTEVVNEEYNNGVVVGGDISVKDPATGHLITVKKWSNIHQRYDDVSSQDQDKEKKEWKKYDDYMQGKSGVAPWQEKSDLHQLVPGKVNYGLSGTGQTIGRVADITLQNLTDQAINVYLPATIVESTRGAQDYFIPQGQDVALKPHEKKTVPLDGTCLERDKSPAGNGDHALIYDDVGDSTPGSHFAPGDVVMLNDIGRSIYEAVDELAKDGAFDKFPYSDKEEQKDIAIQWATWANPDICDITDSPPANKDDFAKTVNDQVPKRHKPDKDTQKKIDDGIDSMWDGIELTSEKAKDLHKTEEDNGGSEDSTPGSSIYIDQSGKDVPKTKSKPTPTPTPKPKPKKPDTPTPGPKKEEKEPGAVSDDDPGRGTEVEEIDLPQAKYPVKKEIDCGTIEIDIGTKGDLIFEFTPKPSDKCPCKEFGWVQHVSPEGYNSWCYDNNAKGSAGKGGNGAPSDPNKANQPTQPPKGKKLENWPNNPWYGGTTDPKKDQAEAAAHPTPAPKISDRPTMHGQKFRTQLVCVATGEVYFTWAWGPVAGADTKLDGVGAQEMPPPPAKK